MTERLHYSVIGGIPAGRTDAERLEIMWEAMKWAGLIGERPLTLDELQAIAPGTTITRHLP